MEEETQKVQFRPQDPKETYKVLYGLADECWRRIVGSNIKPIVRVSLDIKEFNKIRKDYAEYGVADETLDQNVITTMRDYLKNADAMTEKYHKYLGDRFIEFTDEYYADCDKIEDFYSKFKKDIANALSDYKENLEELYIVSPRAIMESAQEGISMALEEAGKSAVKDILDLFHLDGVKLTKQDLSQINPSVSIVEKELLPQIGF